MTEAGTFFSGSRTGSGSVTQETTRFRLGFTWRPIRQILFHTSATRLNRSKEGTYGETRTDYPAVLDGTSSRDVTKNQIRSRLRFLFRRIRIDLYARYTSREVDELFSTDVTESGFDQALFQDLTRSYDELREGIRASLRLKNSVRLTLNLEAYQQKNETDLQDLTWGYYAGDADTEGLNGSYRLSLPSGSWHIYVQGNVQKWDRDLAPPIFDPIYDPTQLLENAATEARLQQHFLTVATQINNTSWNVRVGYIQEKFSIRNPFSESNYQPVEYDLKGILYGLGGAISGPTWSLAGDANYIDTTGSQDHNRIRGAVNFSKKIRTNQTLVVAYHYFNFDEQEFKLDDYQGHFLTFGWRFQF